MVATTETIYLQKDSDIEIGSGKNLEFKAYDGSDIDSKYLSLKDDGMTLSISADMKYYANTHFDGKEYQVSVKEYGKVDVFGKTINVPKVLMVTDADGKSLDYTMDTQGDEGLVSWKNGDNVLSLTANPGRDSGVAVSLNGKTSTETTIVESVNGHEIDITDTVKSQSKGYANGKIDLNNIEKVSEVAKAITESQGTRTVYVTDYYDNMDNLTFNGVKQLIARTDGTELNPSDVYLNNLSNGDAANIRFTDLAGREIDASYFDYKVDEEGNINFSADTDYYAKATFGDKEYTISVKEMVNKGDVYVPVYVPTVITLKDGDNAVDYTMDSSFTSLMNTKTLEWKSSTGEVLSMGQDSNRDSGVIFKLGDKASKNTSVYQKINGKPIDVTDGLKGIAKDIYEDGTINVSYLLYDLGTMNALLTNKTTTSTVYGYDEMQDRADIKFSGADQLAPANPTTDDKNKTYTIEGNELKETLDATKIFDAAKSANEEYADYRVNINGNGGNDTIIGTYGDNTINGGKGDDIITGNGGKNVFVFDGNDFGFDTITDAKKYDAIQLSGINEDDVVFKRANNDLLITDKDYTHVVRLQNYYDKNGNVTADVITNVQVVGEDKDTVEIADVQNENKNVVYDALDSHTTLSDLKFSRDMKNPNTLTITAGAKSVNVANFFRGRYTDSALYVKDGDKESLKSVVENANVDVTLKGRSYTGTKYNETVVSSGANEILNLGTGNDTIIFSGDYGNDVVTANKGETLNLQFTDCNPEYTIKGNDVVLKSKDSMGNYIAQVTLKNYAKKDNGADVKVGQTSFKALKDQEFKVTAGKKGYTGTWLNESVASTKNNETFRMGTGNNQIDFFNKNNNGVDEGDGHDTVYLTKGETLNLKFNDANNELRFEAVGNDLRIYDTNGGNDNDSYVTVKNYVGKDTGAKLKINDVDIDKINNPKYAHISNQSLYDINHLTVTNVNRKGVLTDTAWDDNINVSNYESANGRGVTINSLGGNDTIVGSNWGDTIRTTGTANITENGGGNNRITTGNGADVITVNEYTYNTINAGAGDNEITLNSIGTNRVNVGNDKNTITAKAGYNTIRTGRGNNTVNLDGGVNNVVTNRGNDTFNVTAGTNNLNGGAGDDTYTVSGGKNVVKSGAGIDTLNISGGNNNVNAGDGGRYLTGTRVRRGRIYNTYAYRGNDVTVSGGDNVITSGRHDDTFTISGGTNNINSGKGNDTFDIQGGKNVLNGAQGNDTYKVNMSTFNFDKCNSIIISDNSGANVLDVTLGEGQNLNLFFDVDLKQKRGKAVLSRGKAVGIASNFKFSTDSTVADFDKANGIEVSSGRTISTVKVGDINHGISTSDLNALTQDVASWLNNKNYMSTSDVFNKADNQADIAALVKLYTDFAAKQFGAGTAGV